MKLYSDLAEYYFEIEKPSRKFEEEIEFLDYQFKRFKTHSILDMGCGTGEHVGHLKRRNYKIVGLDSSKSMIEIAKKRFSGSEFIFSEMQNFSFSKNFDAVISVYGSFNYLVSNKEIHSCLESVRNALATSGIFVIELWNSGPILQIKRKAMAPVSMSKIGGLLIQRNRGFKISSKSSDSETNIENLVEVNFSFQLNDKEIKDKHLMRVFSYNEFVAILETHKFEILNVFSTYQMESFTANAGKMIFVAKKK